MRQKIILIIGFILIFLALIIYAQPFSIIVENSGYFGNKEYDDNIHNNYVIRNTIVGYRYTSLDFDGIAKKIDVYIHNSLSRMYSKIRVGIYSTSDNKLLSSGEIERLVDVGTTYYSIPITNIPIDANTEYILVVHSEKSFEVECRDSTDHNTVIWTGGFTSLPNIWEPTGSNNMEPAISCYYEKTSEIIDDEEPVDNETTVPDNSEGGDDPLPETETPGLTLLSIIGAIVIVIIILKKKRL